MTLRCNINDTNNQIRRLGSLLNIETTEADIERLVLATSLEYSRKHHLANWMKEKESKYHVSFYRKGVQGEWQTHMSKGQAEQFQTFAIECGANKFYQF